ncbi:HipA domain-containing protein [uncultured Sphaerochaeta sp.]|uniref:type II toxin-antitoxin system HipA family toxin n=1 Tax=uncultured Sphaerochaeta sp. TaxID=886478 RepID=UPI002A0A3DD2|nr:HipA domain-containing protein [uncultured Sphaerochaeta sp.]
MQRCLFCGKSLETKNSDQWHSLCCKKFFGTKSLPELDLSEAIVEEFAKESVGLGMTITGVQKKLSLHLFDGEKGNPSRLTLVGFPAGFILKPNSADFRELPEAEDMVMRMADAAGIQTVPHALFRLRDGNLAYITRRIDRRNVEGIVHRLPMEDFCQLSGRLTEDKYKGSYEQCAKLVGKWSSHPNLDLANLFNLLLFCFMTGNSDMHLKNFSLIAENTRDYVLSPAYDLLPVQLIIPSDKEETALTLGGKKARLGRSDFLKLAQSFNLYGNVAENLIGRLLGLEENLMEIIEASFASENLKERMKELLFERLAILGKTGE